MSAGRINYTVTVELRWPSTVRELRSVVSAATPSAALAAFASKALDEHNVDVSKASRIEIEPEPAF